MHSTHAQPQPASTHAHLALLAPEHQQHFDELAFWEKVATQSSFGDRIDLKLQPWFSNLRFPDVLAHRFGLIADPNEPGVYLNRREEGSPVFRWLGAHDFSIWSDLFRTCFDWSMSEELWLWKYRDASQKGIGMFQRSQLVAFYGAMPRRVLAVGHPIQAVQIGDVMVAPPLRGRLMRRGAFQMVASTFLEQRLSEGTPYAIAFGFPDRRAMQLATRLGLYREVDRMVELRWTASKTARSLRPWCAKYAPIEPARAAAEADNMWKTMRRAFHASILGIRDTAYLTKRYLEHPVRRYCWLLVSRWAGLELLGIVVCRVDTDNRLEILDLIGDSCVFAALVAAARSFAYDQTCNAIYFWVTASHAHLLQTGNPAVVETPMSVPTNGWVEGSLWLEPRDRWWLTGGDTDFR